MLHLEIQTLFFHFGDAEIYLFYGKRCSSLEMLRVVNKTERGRGLESIEQICVIYHFESLCVLVFFVLF